MAGRPHVVVTVSSSVTSLIISLGVYLEEEVISVVVTVSSSVTYFSHYFTGCVSRRGSDNPHPIILYLFHFLSESTRVPQHTAVV